MRLLFRIPPIVLCALAGLSLSGMGAPAASALGEIPELTITSPANGSVLNDTTPVFRGTSTALGFEEEPVTVRVFDHAEDEVLRLSSNDEPGQAWTVGPGKKNLDPGTYTAMAEQSGGLLKEPGRSPRVSFRVDTTPPLVSISSPPNGSSTSGESLTFSGAAGSEVGDLPTVTLEVFSGSTATAPPLESLTVQAVAGGWAIVAGGLAPGTYAARATQADSAGNVGASGVVSFTIAGPAPGAAPGPPVASFRWFPPVPIVGQTVALVSSSTDASSPITAFAWDLAGSGPFKAAGPVVNTSFSAPGPHAVRLRVTDARGVSSIASETITVSPSLLALMQPFPIVRIAGRETALGVRLSQLTVQTPVGAKVTVACRVHSRFCGLHAQSQVARSSQRRRQTSVLLAFHRFERALRAGVVLEVRVSKAGQIGKYTRFSIRRHRLPARLDRCLASINPKPIECPA